MAKYEKPIQKLNLFLELFAYGITVALYICYLLITTNLLDKPTVLLIAAGIAGGTVLVIALFIRQVRLSRVFNILNSEKDREESVYMYCKKRLLMQPRFEAVLLIARYTIGLGILCFILNYYNMLTSHMIREILIGFLTVVPIAYTFFMFQTEHNLMKYLRDSRLVNVRLPEKAFKPYKISMKIFLLVGSIILMPTIILNEFIYLIKNNLVSLQDASLYVGILGLFIISAATATTFMFIKQVSFTIKDIGNILKQMSTGFISLPFVPLISRDEISKMSNNINEILTVMSDVIRETKMASLELSSSSSEISDSAHQLSENAQQQAATVEEITATVEQLTASGDRSFENIKVQNRKIRDLVDLLDESNRIVKSSGNIMDNALDVKDRLDVSITSTKTLILETVEKMNMVRKGSDQILNSNNIIQDISDKINLLSLNASIEAARAGDAGKGFAVVAGEIGKLADETVTNVKIITEMITKTHTEIGVAGNSLKNVLNETKKSSNFILQFGQAVTNVSNNSKEDLEINKKIQGNADSVMSMADGVKSMLEEQKNALKEMANSISNINQMLQSTAASAEEFVANSQVLSKMAEKMKEKIDFFQ